MKIFHVHTSTGQAKDQTGVRQPLPGIQGLSTKYPRETTQQIASLSSSRVCRWFLLSAMLDFTMYLFISRGSQENYTIRRSKWLFAFYHITTYLNISCINLGEFGANMLNQDQFSHLQHPRGRDEDNDDDAQLTSRYCRCGFRCDMSISHRLGRDRKAHLKSLSVLC
jgi:hypothetical protein